MFLRTDDFCNFSGLWGFLDFLTIILLYDNLDESTTVSSTLPSPPTTSLISTSLGANFDDPVVFNIKVSSAAIHLKPWMKRW